MGRRITDEMVSEMNDRIAQAETTAQAFRLAHGVTDTMLARLLDLNHVDPGVGLGAWGRDKLAMAHGWMDHYRNDDVPADGRGPCEWGFSPHSRRAWQCRHCRRRPIDHRQVPAAVR